MEHYEIYGKKYRKCNKIYHGYRIKSILKVLNHIYKNNKKVHERSLINWDKNKIMTEETKYVWKISFKYSKFCD